MYEWEIMQRKGAVAGNDKDYGLVTIPDLQTGVQRNMSYGG